MDQEIMKDVMSTCSRWVLVEKKRTAVEFYSH